MPDWPDIFAALREGDIAVTEDARPISIGGGDISAAWRIDSIFLKTGNTGSLDMFEAEADGLDELASAGAVRVPKVLACGETGNNAFLATKWIDFDQPGRETERLLGQQLAEMHRHQKEQYGWHRDNTIGLTPQHNQWSENWIEFFREQRLGFQLRLAERNGYGGELQSTGTTLSENIAKLFQNYEPVASLLHGDLWGGNWAASSEQPVIFDPAVYYGDRESDIAMTKLFGGFGPDFYSAYQESWPMEAGHEERLKLYQLYHVLNHLNLFGRGYFGRSMQLIRDLNMRSGRWL